jgi:hypothetical protein
MEALHVRVLWFFSFLRRNKLQALFLVEVVDVGEETEGHESYGTEDSDAHDEADGES